MAFKFDLFINYALIIIVLLLSGSLLQVGYIIPTYSVGMAFATIKLISLKKYNVCKVKINIVIFGLVVFCLTINYLFSVSSNFGNYTTVILLYLLTVLIHFIFREKEFIYYFYKVFKIFIISFF